MEDRVRRWLRAHPKVQAYVSREEYEKIRELASSMNVSVSELVRSAVLNLKKLGDEVYRCGFNDGYKTAIDDVRSWGPYELLGIEEFTAPCSKCGKPMLFTSRRREFWEKKVKPLLVKTFFDFVHKDCIGSSPQPAQ